MKSKNNVTTFLPLKTKIGGPFKSVKHNENISLTTDQASHIHKKVELEGIVNVDTIRQKIEEDKLSKNNIDEVGEINPHHDIIIGKI